MGGRVLSSDQAGADLVAELHRAGVVEVDAGRRRRAEYSSDGSLYRVPPLAVAFPRSDDEVIAAMSAARTLQVPVTMRGGGTSVAGNAIGPGLVLDTSRHLARVLDVDVERRTARVQPGVVLDALQGAAAPHGLRFGPDPSTHARCTLGGMIGNDACGSRALGYGRTSDNVVDLDVVTGQGERVTVGAGSHPSASALLGRLSRLAEESGDVLRRERGRFGRQISGYALEHLLPERGFDVAKALVGSEGTCAVVLEATVALTAVPACTVLVVLGYPDMPTAADAVPQLLPHRPIAVEGMDARLVGAVRAAHGSTAIHNLPRGAGWLFVELAGEDVEELAARARALVRDAGALDSAVHTDPRASRRLWRIRDDGSGLASRTPAGVPAYSGWEDAAVPPAQLGDYLRSFDRLLEEHGLTALPFGHFGDGCVHVRLDFPFARTDGPVAFRRFLTDAARLVAEHGGSNSGEHGDGRARSELLPLMYSPDAIRAFGAFKAAFDPDDLLNPGVLVDPRPLDADLRSPRSSPAYTGGLPLAFEFRDDQGSFAAAVHRCVGLGKCRADLTGHGGVMCPSFLATRDERDSTRGRARVLQEMVRGTLVTDGWRSPEVHDALDLCLACKGCSTDCPAGVDIATYKAEVLHQTYRHRIRPRSHYALGWLPRWARLAALAPWLVNLLLGSERLGRVARRLGGVDRRRALPRFSPRTFRHWSRARPAQERPAGSRQPVMLWVDTFTNHFTPQVGRAAVRVLEDAGYEVIFPRQQLCCGLTWISTGQLDAARKKLRRVVDALAPVARAGIPIVGLEPSCTAVLRGDARELLGHGDEAARDVALAVRTLAEALAAAEPAWSPPDLGGHVVVAQPHCHQRAVMGWEADRLLLESAGAQVEVVGGCCGLAGNFGVEAGHYEVSVAVAETSLLPALRAARPSTTVVADGFSCRAQIEELADTTSVHLAEVLARKLPGLDARRGTVPL